MPVSRAANCIFCDDIRFELGNKTSLMGIYQSDMIFGAAAPVFLPKLVIAFWLITDIEDKPSDVSVRIIAPGGAEILNTPLHRVPQESGHPEDGFRWQIHGQIQLGNITFTQDGFLECWIDTETGSLRAGRVKISFAGLPEIAQLGTEDHPVA